VGRPNLDDIVSAIQKHERREPLTAFEEMVVRHFRQVVNEWAEREAARLFRGCGGPEPLGLLGDARG
jgi:hypothetical protein